MKKAYTREELRRTLMTGGMSKEEATELLDATDSTYKLAEAIFEAQTDDCLVPLIANPSKFLYATAKREWRGINFNAFSNETKNYAEYPLSDSRHNPMRIFLPTRELVTNNEVKSLKLKQLFHFDHIGDDYIERELDPGAYVIVGRPASGKSALGRGAMVSLIKEGYSVAYLNVMEPLSREMRAAGCASAILDVEIRAALNAIFRCDSDILYIDSLRFLAAISRYPARTGGIPGGLELYATVFDEAAARLGKRLFLIITTSDSREMTNELYTVLMQGAVQGVIIPRTLIAEDIGTLTGQGEITLRGADRTRTPFTVQLDAPVSLSVGRETLERLKKGTTNEQVVDSLTK